VQAARPPPVAPLREAMPSAFAVSPVQRNAYRPLATEAHAPAASRIVVTAK